MRSELDTLRELYRYNSKTRKKYLDTIWRLPVKDRYRKRGASFPTLVDIFLHVLDAYRWWFLSGYARDTNWTEYPLGVRMSRAEAVRAERAVDRMLSRTLATFRSADLERNFPVPGSRRRISVRVMLLHMAEEELQHRGEMNALLWQQDVDPPITGFGE